MLFPSHYSIKEISHLISSGAYDSLPFIKDRIKSLVEESLSQNPNRESLLLTLDDVSSPTIHTFPATQVSMVEIVDLTLPHTFI